MTTIQVCKNIVAITLTGVLVGAVSVLVVCIVLDGLRALGVLKSKE